MSIDTRPPQNTTPPTASAKEPAKPKLDLSLTQVLGSALAAMTAAYLGSRLSVAGTVVGAALASIVAAVAGSVYTASLRSTRARVRTVWQGRVAGSALPASVELVGGRDGAHPTAPLTQSNLPATLAPVRSRRLSWKSVAAVALAAFALAGVTLTGVELATGSALSGGDGTTLNQVTEQVTEPRRSDPKPTASTSPEPAEPSPSATASSSTEPSVAPGPVVTSAPPQQSPEPTENAPTPAPAPSNTLPVEPTGTSEATPDPSG